jgi:DNA polymerase-3 subunit delta'
MSFQTIPGQERAKRILRNSLRNDRISHAYIFSGPVGTGRRNMARTLAKAIYCNVGGDDACGVCLECRKVEHGNHPDVYWIEPEGTSVKIEQIRELQKQFSYRSVASDTKIYMINQAERMTVQASNSLLKFLEEPQSSVVAILITENGHALLPTIQSRAQWIPFAPLTSDEMKPVLIQEGLPAELVLPAVQITAGLDTAREFIQANWFAETRNIVIQLMKECLTNSPSAVLTVQQKVIKTEIAEHIGTLFDLFILWFKDMIYASHDRKEKIVYIDHRDWISKHALTRKPVFWVECMEKAVEMQKRLRFHVNPQLALEHFIIQVQGG